MQNGSGTTGFESEKNAIQFTADYTGFYPIPMITCASKFKMFRDCLGGDMWAMGTVL